MPSPSEEEAEAARSELQELKRKGPGTIVAKERLLDRLGDELCLGIVIHDYWMSKIVQAIEQEGNDQQ